MEHKKGRGAVLSLPSRGAWIEMSATFDIDISSLGSSLPSRGAWIEILSDEYQVYEVTVAPLTGSVD